MIAVVLLVAVGLFLLWGAQKNHRLRSAVPGGVTTTGQVLSVDVEHQKGQTLYTPTIEFVDRGGQTHDVDGPGDTRHLTVGDEVQVSYDPDDPSDAHELIRGSHNWEITLGVGIACFVAAVAVAGGPTLRRVRQAHPRERRSGP